jgi:uncharacterized protein (TIGR04255 family)
MTTRPDDLPDYERPPLNELVLSVQFGILPFKNVHAGILWQRFANSFPKVEEQAPIEPVFETFGPPEAREVVQLSVKMMPAVQPLRYWFVSADGNELLQDQRDRLIHNWRHQKPGDSYPRYEPLHLKFAGEIAVAQEVFRELGLGEIACNQCEVGYINLIMLDDGTDPNSRLSEIFTIVTEEYSDAYLRKTKLERGRFRFSYVIPAESGKEPVGRLHLEIQPVIRRPDNRPAIRFSVTARGKPTDETVGSALSWLDIGRDAGVRAFTSVTTKEMHRLWGRIQ